MKPFILFFPLITMLLWFVSDSRGQEQPKVTKISGQSATTATDAKNDDRLFVGVIKDLLNAPKEKFQKEIQDKIQSQIDNFDNKLRDLKTVTGISEAKANGYNKTLSKSGDSQTQNEANNNRQPPEEEKPKPSQSFFWDKVTSISETYMGLVKKAYDLLASFFK